MSDAADPGTSRPGGEPGGEDARLRDLASFASVIREPGFTFGQWHAAERRPDGTLLMPWFEFSDAALSLIFAAAGLITPGFDWPSWAQSEEAQLLKNVPAAMAGAGPAEISKMLTWLVRSDRFTEGSLAGAYESGLLGRLLDRVAVLAKEQDRPA